MMKPTSLPLQGIAASPGYSQGRLYFLNQESKESTQPLTGTPLEQWQQAIAGTRVELLAMIEKAKKTLGEHEAQIFETHLMFLDDPEFSDAILRKIKTGSAAVAALQETADQFVALFSSMEDPYLRERALDIKDVSQRLRRHLEGKVTASYDWQEPRIVVAEELTPSETILMDPSKVLAFVTEKGGATSHTVILARNLGIPAIVGVKNLTSSLQQYETISKVLVDAYKGHFWINPEVAIEQEFLDKQKKEAELKEVLKNYKNKTVATRTGEKMHLKANIGSVADLHLATEYGAEGIGLFRTEFLFMGKDQAPSEEEQFQAYKTTVEAAKPHRAVIRTADIGGDKELAYWDLPKEENPFLGVRGLRLSLKFPEIFKTQLRALLRAAEFGDIGILLPMVTTVDEVVQTKKLIQTCREELQSEGHILKATPALGVMVEIPSVALMLEDFAPHADFFSLGTNDLLQYSTAVDRGNADLADLYQPSNPGFLRLLKMIQDSARAVSRPVCICGDLAGNEALVPTLVEMGYRELSMSSRWIPRVKYVIDSSGCAHPCARP